MLGHQVCGGPDRQERNTELRLQEDRRSAPRCTGEGGRAAEGTWLLTRKGPRAKSHLAEPGHTHTSGGQAWALGDQLTVPQLGDDGVQGGCSKGRGTFRTHHSAQSWGGGDAGRSRLHGPQRLSLRGPARGSGSPAPQSSMSCLRHYKPQDGNSQKRTILGLTKPTPRTTKDVKG